VEAVVSLLSDAKTLSCLLYLGVIGGALWPVLAGVVLTHVPAEEVAIISR
jgi:fucose permease